MATTTTTIDLPVLGMTCAACVRRVERAALAVPGIASAEVNLPLSRARVVAEPAQVEHVVAAIRAAGYEIPADAMTPTRSARERLAAIERAHVAETAGLGRDAVVAIAVTIPLVAIAMTGVLAPTAGVIAQLVLGTIVVGGPGMRYLRAGVRAVRHASPDMNTLIALGASAAWLSSTIAAARWLRSDTGAQVPELYFEAGAAIVAFVMIGKLLEARARARLADAVRGLVALAPATATKATGEQVDAATLVPGDVIVVKPGERIAADGTVVEGQSAVDESLLTGEAMPVDKAEGAAAYAGTLNHHGALSVRVARAGAETSLARIAHAVEDAQSTKPPIARLADRASAVFVPAVLAIASTVFVAWLVAGASASEAVEPMVAVLVIACPCALGLATPAAIAVGAARGAELGVLFHTGTALEVASRIRVACLDKTGTLTAGAPALIGEPDREALRLAASAELASEHPIARAIVEGARARGLPLTRPTAAVIEPGGGIAATVGDARVRVGNRGFLELAEVAVPTDPGATAAGATMCYVATDRRFAGVLAVADPPADGAREAIAQLGALGIETVMISGDRDAAARMVAQAVGIARVRAGVQPTEKAALVAAERVHGPVAMVGDGVNDAPALAAADLGVALGSGTDIARGAADVTLLRGGIVMLPAAFALARATLRTIRRNLLAASIYNLVCIPIAAAGLLSPMVAAAAMSLSSVSVLVSSLALRSTRLGLQADGKS